MQTTLLKHNSVSYEVEEPVVLESGRTLRNLRIQYTTYGELNEDRSNVVWVFHALTANSEVEEWWAGLIGNGDLFNPDEHFIVCANMLGSCYGSTEPLSYDFPLVTIKDIVSAHQLLFKKLELSKISVGIGGSMGGQQLMEWAVQEPELFDTIIPIATNAEHSPWGIAFNEAQRMALDHPDPKVGIANARAIAMLSYRHYDTYSATQKDGDGRVDNFSASSYQNYQGEKLEKRFSPISYYYLSKAMDTHNVGRHFESIESALSRIQSRAIVVGIASDILFPPSEQEFLADHIPSSSFHTITSIYGHDGFLIETEQLTQIIEKELK